MSQVARGDLITEISRKIFLRLDACQRRKPSNESAPMELSLALVSLRVKQFMKEKRTVLDKSKINLIENQIARECGIQQQETAEKQPLQLSPQSR